MGWSNLLTDLQQRELEGLTLRSLDVRPDCSFQISLDGKPGSSKFREYQLSFGECSSISLNLNNAASPVLKSIGCLSVVSKEGSNDERVQYNLEFDCGTVTIVAEECSLATIRRE
jgi:hypothetical protein